MKKNDLLTGFCEQIGYNGEGIFHINGTTFFVPYCLIGEKVTFKILKIKKTIGYGKIVEIVTPSPNRIEPQCPVFTKCGGCQLMHADHNTQLEIKKQTVIGAFKKIANLDVKIDNAVTDGNIFGYRNKLSLPIREINGQVKIGFFRENSHDIVPITKCFIQPDWSKDLIEIFTKFIDGKTITAYNESTLKGLFRHVVVREVGGEFIITLVINGNQINGVNGLIEALLAKFSKLSVYININKTQSNVIFGDTFKLIYGNGKIKMSEFGLNFEIGPQSFLQVNTNVKKLMYQFARERAKIDDEYVVIDGYSGAGVLTALLSQGAKKAYGVEIIPEAVEAANQLAKENEIENMTSILSPCEDILPELIQKESSQGNKTVLILDPPRKGVDLKILQTVNKCLPDKIIYIACSPQSLARDIGVIMDSFMLDGDKIVGINSSSQPKYKIDGITLFDLFPQTKHVECVVLMSKY